MSAFLTFTVANLLFLKPVVNTKLPAMLEKVYFTQFIDTVGIGIHLMFLKLTSDWYFILIDWFFI